MTGMSEDDAKVVVQAAARVLMDAALRLLERDPHSFSPRPCSTCESVSAISGRPWGCVAKAVRA